MTIDLHAHSTRSDGDVSPADLVRRAAAAGLTVVALTDHDTYAGIDDAAAALPSGLTLIPGVEISCDIKVDGQMQTAHLLVYLMNRWYQPLTATLASIRQARIERAQIMVGKITDAGYPLLWADVVTIAGTSTIGKPHIAQAMVNAGILTTVAEAYTPAWLDSGSPYYVPKWQPDIQDILPLVLEARGVPVLAHPRGKRGSPLDDHHLETLARAGLAGVEVDHPEHDAAARGELRGLAAELGLIVTGSSDFHGSRKPQGLGAETTSREAYKALVAATTGAKPIMA
ncbi:PHP domain-containing protein [Frankia sp. QA3]|uniref:PHP domain-containing protein n=1 Tax=Frankia sp. QA3 TaxID=710111 RepID=UPI000269BCD5|nr:PHP domain-containing protein [Frankia sp. QA3]EIV92258.1 putative metal-dependent phosphoesterase, PHP family [Frankia sp. QA3]